MLSARARTLTKPIVWPRRQESSPKRLPLKRVWQSITLTLATGNRIHVSVVCCALHGWTASSWINVTVVCNEENADKANRMAEKAKTASKHLPLKKACQSITLLSPEKGVASDPLIVLDSWALAQLLS